MRLLLTMVLWGILAVLCWPLAILVLLLWPILWVISIPLRAAGAAANALLALVRALLLLPARILGHREAGT